MPAPARKGGNGVRNDPEPSSAPSSRCIPASPPWGCHGGRGFISLNSQPSRDNRGFTRRFRAEAANPSSAGSLGAGENQDGTWDEEQHQEHPELCVLHPTTADADPWKRAPALAGLVATCTPGGDGNHHQPPPGHRIRAVKNTSKYRAEKGKSDSASPGCRWFYSFPLFGGCEMGTRLWIQPSTAQLHGTRGAGTPKCCPCLCPHTLGTLKASWPGLSLVSPSVPSMKDSGSPAGASPGGHHGTPDLATAPARFARLWRERGHGKELSQLWPLPARPGFAAGAQECSREGQSW